MVSKGTRGKNLTTQDRERGGRASASKQDRDARGQFAGARKKANPVKGDSFEGRLPEPYNSAD